jgi:transcriptional regulator with XRE-family HTH domain
MGRKLSKLSDEVREAIEDSGMSRYRICKELGMDQATMSRFMHGKQGLSLEDLDALAALLDLHVITGKPRRKKG